MVNGTVHHTLELRCFNAVQRNNRCLFSDPHKTHKYTVWAERRIIYKDPVPQKRERTIIVGFLNSEVNFEFPKKRNRGKLEDVLEADEDVAGKFFASSHIIAKRLTKHKSVYNPGIWHENKGGNISSHPYSCALRAGASYNYLLVNGKRRLTPREMLRLQGFPDTFQIVCNDSQTRKQAGNAVPVNVIRAVLKDALYAEAEAERQQRESAV